MPTHNDSTQVYPVRYEALTIKVPVWPEGHRLGSTGLGNQKRRAMARDAWRCQMENCNHKRNLQAHHITPRSNGGTDNIDNLIILCNACHRRIHEENTLDQHAPQFRQTIKHNRHQLHPSLLFGYIISLILGGVK